MAEPDSPLSSFSHDAVMPDQQAIRARITRPGAHALAAHPSVIERRRTGRIARAYVTREELGQWSAPWDRVDPGARLRARDRELDRELVPARHAWMARSVRNFYRGSASIMAADLAAGLQSGLEVQLCGDADVANIGVFRTRDGGLVADARDMGETAEGPFEWDVKRLVTSLVLVARERGWRQPRGEALATAACEAYRAAMADFAAMREIDVWHRRTDVESTLPGVGVRHSSGRGLRRGHARSLTHEVTEVVSSQRVLVSRPPQLMRLDLTDSLRAWVNGLFRSYREGLSADSRRLLQRYQIIDVGYGTARHGASGRLALLLLMRGRDDDDVLLLHVRRCGSSAGEAQRIVNGQRLIEAVPDPLLGAINGGGGSNYVVHQLRQPVWPRNVARLGPSRLTSQAELCARVLARAHARSGDAIAMDAYLGSGRCFDRSMAAFASSYADQVERDFAEYLDAIGAGRVALEHDPEGRAGIKAVRRLARRDSTAATSANPAADVTSAAAAAAASESDAAPAVVIPRQRSRRDEAGPAAKTMARKRTARTTSSGGEAAVDSPDAVPATRRRRTRASGPRRPSPWTSVPPLRFADGVLNGSQWPR